MDLAVSGDAAPPELESPAIAIACNSSREISLDNAGKLSYKVEKIFILRLDMKEANNFEERTMKHLCRKSLETS